MKAVLRVRVIPRSKRNEIAGWREEALVVRLTAPPVGGAANKLLKRFLAERLGVRASDIEITHGTTIRDKILQIEGISPDTLAQKLA
ncbi:MAG: DUF167 domain-containing protein [Candidatus Zipacnadales bacterium]